MARRPNSKGEQQLVQRRRGKIDVSRIYDALTIAEDQVVERFAIAPGAHEEPFATQGSRRVSLPLDISPVWNQELQGSVPQLRGNVEVSRSKVRSLLLLGFLTI